MVESYVFKSRNKKSSSLKRVRAKRSNGLFRLVRNDAMFFYEPALIPPPTSNALLENGPWMKIYGFIVLKKNVWFSIGREICLWCMSSTLNRIRAVCWEAWAVDGSGEAGFLKWKSGSELTIFGHVFFFKIGFFRCYLNMFSSVYSLHLLESTNDSNDHDGIHLKRLETTDFSLNLWNWPLQDLTSLSWFLFNKLKNWLKETLWVLQLGMKSEQNLRFFFWSKIAGGKTTWEILRSSNWKTFFVVPRRYES